MNPDVVLEPEEHIQYVTYHVDWRPLTLSIQRNGTPVTVKGEYCSEANTQIIIVPGGLP